MDNTDVNSLDYKQAIYHFNQKDFRQSAYACRRALKQFPNSINTLNLFALSAHHLKKFKMAALIYKIATTRFPGNIILLNNQGSILKAQGDISGAISAYQQAIAVSSQNTESLFNLANVFQEIGQLLRAVDCYQKVLQVDSNNIEALLRAGGVLQRLGQYRIALKAFKKVLALKADHFAALMATAICLQTMDLHQEAIGYYLHALQLEPNNAQAYVNLGVAYKKIEEFALAIECYEKAIVFVPNVDYIYTNMANALHSLDRDEEALVYYQKALDLNPDSVEAYNGRGFTQYCMANFDIAEQNFAQALGLNPKHVDAHFNRSLNYLVQGDFKRGWPEYEWRLQKPEMEPLIKKIPYTLWDGSDLNGRSLMIFAEQGFGDNIQFIRYIPLINKQGGKIYLATRQELYHLFEQIPEIDYLSSQGELLSNIDCYVPLLSLPHLFDTTLETIPADIPYLHAYKDDIARFSALFKVGKKELKIGICWTGSPTHKNAQARSCQVDDFLPLLEVPGAIFYSLQKGGNTATELAKTNIIDLSEHLVNFSATAALIAHLDLVITVDTSVAHLAGAMGKPVWNLLSFNNDWRWLRDRSDTPWYPTMRLFRQQHLYQWEPVFAELKVALQKFKKPKAS